MTAGGDGRTRVDVKLPQLGETVAEGTVTSWLASVGDEVEEDEPLCEVSTDKVNTEIPSPASGEVVELLAEEGETVEVGVVVARIAVAGPEDAAAGADAAAGGGGGADDGGEAAAGGAGEERPHFEDSSISLWGGGAESEETVPADAGGAGGGADASPAAGGEASPGDGETAAPEEEAAPRRYSPAVRALARREEIPLEEVEGTGRGGRVTREDVRRHAEAQAGGSGGRPAGGRREELSPVRRVIAERLSKSTSEIPHSTTVMEADLEAVARIRERAGGRFEEREGVRLTYLPFVASATLRALEEHPRMNAVFEGDAVRHRPEVNLGVAVATEEGLLVPVVPEAGGLSFPGLARAIAEAAEAARSGTLEPGDVEGGTFTITNHGRGGSLLGTPIIVPGQTGILGVGRIGDEAVAVDGEVAVRKRCRLSLSFDHRTVDGADADAFLRTIVETLSAFDAADLRGGSGGAGPS